MIWDGKTVYSLWNYQPLTEPAIKWHELSSGNWRGSDRGASEDIYKARVTFEGPIAELLDLETALDDNRTFFSATFNTGEEIFGADVDHSISLNVIPVVYGKIRKLTFKHFGMDVVLRLDSPTFKSDTPDFTQLRTASHADTRETVFEINKMFTFDGVGFAADHLSNDGIEAGMYKARFTQTIKEMAAIRRYLLVTARSNQIAFPDFGNIDYPFGTRSGTGPFNCRVIAWQDLGRHDYQDWGLEITFAKDNSYWNESPDDYIQETGSAPDVIQETGSQPDIIQEVLN